MTSHFDHDEVRLAQLLQETRLPGAPVDEALLARLRQNTAQLVESVTISPSSVSAHSLPASNRSASYWRRPMVRYRLSLAASAVLLIGLTMISWWKPASNLTLGSSLADLERLASFEATWKNDQGIETIRYVQPAMLRVDRAGSYILHRDGQSWEVNEAENRATRRASSLFKDDKLNIAQLLHLPGNVKLSEEPVDIKTPRPGVEERLYHLGRSTLQLRWLIDAATRQTLKIYLVDQIRQPMLDEEFTLVAMNPPMPAGAFQLKDTLTEDGRVGVVQDIQGIVSVRPVGKERWTPLAVGDLLKPGDLVQANPRGPNAARLRMVPNTDVTFGPGASLELKTPVEYRLLTGEIEVHPRDRKVTIISPAPSGADKTVVDAKTVLKADAEKLITLKDQPAWLKGFQGTVVNESLGQLLAKVDDRNVPLNVGYHKVDVEIRDGLARTTVEESFINTTNTELEGTFYFPLPSDASIAGFGMWIGNELVEADIVEKQRAREIFDIILSEKKDPALLEWAGGNLFKTRVYPIPARGEKRIKITYTQALPLEGNRFRYSYALLSDLLKQHPLKELNVNVTVSSAWPLAKVFSPTHAVREEKAGTAARLVFTAQEYVPTRDFEAVIEMASTPSPVTLLPHRRGDDGYFLLRLAPPQGNAGWEREVVRDGPPLHLLLLCDTSASIDKQQRQQQRAFVDALLGSLTVKDTFNLACFDVETDWAFPQQQAAETKSITQAQALLTGRRSMGWTDFEKAFASAQKQAAMTPNTVIIYLGDGIPAMSWGHDPKVLVERLKKLVSRDKAPVHAVALGSTHEPQTLRAMASLSGGSWRKIAADRGPALQARDLLQELTDPNLLHDLKVSFEGLQTAKVYPETLPNVQQGTGLVLTGRYLPSGKAQTGKVIVSGLRGNTPISYQAAITLPDGDAGNSFIPRLWARQHIESLLETGGVAARDEIIARSEEFHLMTPYTSMLVLENDTMRERFAVKKRFNMRDGERFFADGKAQSELLLRQKQMKLAADWRINMQQQTLTQLGMLGKWQIQPRQIYPSRGGRPVSLGINVSPEVDGLYRSSTSPMAIELVDDSDCIGIDGKMNLNTTSNTIIGLSPRDLGGDLNFFEAEQLHGRFGGGYPMGGGGGMGGMGGGMGGISGEGLSGIDRRELGEIMIEGNQPIRFLGKNELSDFSGKERWVTESMNEQYDKRLFDPAPVVSPEPLIGAYSLDGYGGRNSRDLRKFDDELSSLRSQSYGMERMAKSKSDIQGLYYYDAGLSIPIGGPRLGLQQLFPMMSGAPLIRKPVAGKPPVWSPEIVEIIKSLDKRALLKQQPGSALMLDRVSENYDVRRAAMWLASKRSEYLTSTGWQTIQTSDQASTLINWCTPTERVALNLTYFTGRQRPSSPPEREDPPIEWDDKSLDDLLLAYGQLPAKLEKLAGNRARITFTYPEELAVRWTIDLAKQVLLQEEHLNQGKVNSRVVFADFQHVAGRWWAGRRTAYDAQGRMQTQSIQKVQAVAEEMVAQKLTEAKKEQARCFMLTSPSPTVAEAKQATAPGGTGGAVAHLVLLTHFANTQQWARVNEHLAQLEALPQKYAVVPWIKLLVLNASRDHATLQNTIWKDAQALLKQPIPSPGDDWTLFAFLQQQLMNISTPQETLRFLEAHQGIYTRQPAYLRMNRNYLTHRAQYLYNASRREEALAIWKQLAESDLFDASAQWSYFSTLLQANDVATAQKHLLLLMEPSRLVFLEPSDSEQYWQQLFMKLHELGRYADAFGLASQWAKLQPTVRGAQTAYLLSLVLTEQEAEFTRSQLNWITAGPGAKANTTQDAQFEAALYLVLRHSHFGFEHQWQLQLDEKLYAPLIAFAEAHLTDPRQVNHVMMVLGSEAGNSALGMKLREGLAARVHEECATLPIEKLQALIQNAGYASAPTEAKVKAQTELWKQTAAKIKARWQGIQDPKAKYAMGDLLCNLLQNRISRTEYLAFLRERLQGEADDYRLGLLNQLYSLLIQLDLTADTERELFSLIPQLDGPNQPASALLAVRTQRLAQLADRLFEYRHNKLQAAIPEKEKLDRVKLLEKQTAATKQAHRETAERLQQPDVKLEMLTPWVAAEVLYHRIKAGEDLTAIADATWKAYDAVPVAVSKVKPADIKTVEELDQLRQDTLHEMLRSRHLTVLTYIASKQPKIMEKLKSFVVGKLQAEPQSMYWRTTWQRLLVALDLPRELEASLKQWVLTDGANQRYRLTLAYLQAERGGLQEAVDLIEKVKAEDELAPDDWRALSDWLLALNQQARHHQAKAQQFAASSEQELYRILQVQQNLVSRNRQGVPPKLDDDVFLAIPELLQKSQSPMNYFYVVQNLYETTKDFRLLAGLADGTLGHTPGQLYPMLQNWHRIIQTMQDEATLDELDKRITELRKKSSSPIDMRALDLLEAFLHRKAATMINQPDVHARKAVECLARAMKHQWQPEEPVELAKLFYGMPQEAHAAWKEQLIAAFTQLLSLTPPGSAARCEVAYYFAAHHPQPFVFLRQMIDEVRNKQNGLMPEYSQNIMGTYLGMSAANERETEEFAQQELKRPGYSAASLEWFKNQLQSIFIRAYQSGGTVSLGKGQELYRALESLFEKELNSAGSQERRHHYMSLLSNHYRQALMNQQPTVAADCKAMLMQRITPRLQSLTYQRRELVATLANTLYDVTGKPEGMQFLLDEYDRAPFSSRHRRYDAWDAYQHLLASWRPQINDVTLLDRYFRIVTERLTNYLVHGTNQNEVFIKGHQYYWAEKEDAFASTAIAVFAAREPSANLAERVSNYLRHTLGRNRQAADFLQSIRKTPAFTQDIQFALAMTLIDLKEYQQALAELKQLQAAKPRLRYALQLMTCYHALHQQDDLKRMLSEIEKQYVTKNVWPTNILEQVAQHCYDTQLYLDAERLYAILIPQYRREQGDKNLDQGKLWSYYSTQALTLVALDKTAPALDSISSAIVLWGSSFQQRADVLENLRNVMKQAKDPQAVIAYLDNEAKKNGGRENVLLRRMLAEVLMQKQQTGLAVSQLKLVLEIKPEDDAASKLLIEAYDTLKQPEEALKVALHRSEFVSRQSASWKELGDRFAGQKDNTQAERAYTSIIEVLPNDAEAEIALAQVREKQERWNEAIVHWKHANDYRLEDPSGLLGLAKAYVHEKQWPEAKATLDLLQKPAKPWHQRFNALNVNEQAAQLRKSIP